MENTKYPRLSGRLRRKYHSYGFTTKEEQLAEHAAVKKDYEEMYPAGRKELIHCSYMDYKADNSKHENLIRQAISMGIGGKHVRSKSERKLKNRIHSIERQVAKYMTALNAAEELKKALEAQKAAEETPEVSGEPEIRTAGYLEPVDFQPADYQPQIDEQ